MPDYENWATSPRAITWDESLAFESPLLAQAYQTWAELGAGAIPARSRFTPRAVKAFVGHLTIFEKMADGGYLIRLMGTRIAATLGEMQGKRLEEALPALVATRWSTALTRALDEKKPLRIVTVVSLNDLHFLEAEIFIAPLSDDAGALNMVFTTTVFRAGVAKSTAVADLVGQK
ncbi:hypothetical protein FHS83_000173 [Rhizomicrobium palustre]|uniref:PAS domain-containing protein n=1 Tax=Rhizomicrobium palustre TaxID=189966 RepID=A0A846MUD8_9PROT|nr:PAS domain-containing protein [Rhizomicrobium palustre]NIK86855.1 hypothetical protein [Rhizomicrobium palustre]